MSSLDDSQRSHNPRRTTLRGCRGRTPMSRVIDLAGHIYGRLRVVRRVGSLRNKSLWRCECSCGQSIDVDSNSLREGHTRSCGCLKREVSSAEMRARATKHGASSYGKRTREYRAWCRMIQRCTDPNFSGFIRYGTRGIAVSPKWRHDFLAFLRHVGPSPGPKYTIDRIKNAQGYVPGNVRWTTNLEQQRNRSNNHLVTIRGVTAPLIVWSERYRIRKDTLRVRLVKLGWTPERAIDQPVRPRAR